MTHPDPIRDRRTATSDDHLIYVVDDEADIRSLLVDTLGTYRFRAEGFATASDALTALELRRPDVVVLDLGLPDMDGMDLINRIRARTAVPIIVLSARAHTSDRIMGLETGADDYVIKPFDPREIVARIRSLLRRTARDSEPPAASREVAHFAGWAYEPQSHRLVAPSGEETFLPSGEASLLEALLRAPKRVLSRDYLLDLGGRDDTLDRAIDVRISRIRKKLGDGDPPIIRTIYGSGYMLTAAVNWGAVR